MPRNRIKLAQNLHALRHRKKETFPALFPISAPAPNPATAGMNTVFPYADP